MSYGQGHWGRRSDAYDRIVAALKAKQPQTGEMLKAAVGRSNTSMYCTLLLLEGAIVARTIEGKRWLAVDAKVFAKWDAFKKEQELWREGAATLSAVRKRLRTPSRSPNAASAPAPSSPR